MIRKHIQITIDIDLMIDQEKSSKELNDSIEKVIVEISKEVELFPSFYKVRKNKSAEEILSSGDAVISVRIDGELINKEIITKNNEE